LRRSAATLPSGISSTGFASSVSIAGLRASIDAHHNPPRMKVR
jgi:hypothetical protein